VERDGDGKFLVVAPQEHDHLLITGVLANLTPGQDVANAALIVRAVNRDHHLAPLMEALEVLLKGQNIFVVAHQERARKVLNAAQEATR